MLGSSSIDVTAVHRGSAYTTTVDRHARLALTIGAVLPGGSKIASATLNGRPVKPKLVRTARGLEARVSLPAGRGSSTLELVTAVR
jgi:hypothetical protein